MRLYAGISAHGFGHIAQTGPILEAVWRIRPELELHVACDAPEPILRQHIPVPFTLHPGGTDFGAVNPSALQVDVEGTLQAYRQFHRRWEERVEAESARLRRIAPHLVVANVSYLLCEAAHRAGIPAVALSSLDWAHILADLARGRAELGPLLRRITDAYHRAEWFIALTPHMSMPRFERLRPVGPVTRLGRLPRGEVRSRMGVGEEERLVMINLGGIDTPLPVEEWQRPAGVRWLVPGEREVPERGILAMGRAGVAYPDLLRACDAIVTKPGYGNVTGAACNGVPMVYARRNRWSEEPALIEWAARHNRIAEVTAGHLYGEGVAVALEQVWRQPAPPTPLPRGAEEAARLLLQLLS